jgi:phenylalanyl-tRNA synthetase beta chain
MPRGVPVLPADYETLVRLIGRRIDRDELAARVPMMGGSYEGEKEGKLQFEFFPNRPDLLSVEGLARACRAFFDVRPGLASYEVANGTDQVRIDPTVAKVRPHIGFARVTGVPFDDAFLADIIDVQERLTTGPGRRRKKVAIGVHDAAPVRAPFTYKAVRRDEVRFVPLQMAEALTPDEIFERHEKGRLFRHLLDGHDRVPLIVDADGQVLSLPPIINGQLTALTPRTRDVLVDVTGTDARATLGILNILVAALAERGGRIESLELVHARTGKPLGRTPDLSPRSMRLPLRRVQELLGLSPTPDEVRAWLGRMGHDVTRVEGKSADVRSAAWRLDLLHPDDLVEDVAIGYGFERLTPRLPRVAQFGGVHPRQERMRRARTLLLGLGFTEVVTLTITSRADALERVGAADASVVEVANPVTLEHNVLRPHLYTGLLALLRANKHRELPQSVFEVGYVVPNGEGDPPANELRAAALRAAPRAPFAEAKGVAEAFMRDLGLSPSIEPATVPGFLPGRTARLVQDGREVGFLGELHPETVQAFELSAPVYGFEVRL